MEVMYPSDLQGITTFDPTKRLVDTFGRKSFSTEIDVVEVEKPPNVVKLGVVASILGSLVDDITDGLATTVSLPLFVSDPALFVEAIHV